MWTVRIVCHRCMLGTGGDKLFKESGLNYGRCQNFPTIVQLHM